MDRAPKGRKQANTNTSQSVDRRGANCTIFRATFEQMIHVVSNLPIGKVYVSMYLGNWVTHKCATTCIARKLTVDAWDECQKKCEGPLLWFKQNQNLTLKELVLLSTKCQGRHQGFQIFRSSTLKLFRSYTLQLFSSLTLWLSNILTLNLQTCICISLIDKSSYLKMWKSSDLEIFRFSDL